MRYCAAVESLKYWRLISEEYCHGTELAVAAVLFVEGRFG